MTPKQLATLEKLTREANEQGFELLGPGRDRLYRTYQCNSCGEACEKLTTAMRKGTVRCSTCYLVKLREQASEAGFELVGDTEKSARFRYRCLVCSGEQEFLKSCIQSGSVRCQRCYVDSLRKEAEKVGLALVRFVKGEPKVTYRCHTCDGTFGLRIDTIRKGHGSCPHCRLSRHQEEAEKQGFTLVGPGTSSDRRIYECLDCGGHSEYQIPTMRVGWVCCNHCKESHWSKQSHFYVHIIHHKDFPDSSWVKIGVAIDVERRVGSYGLIEGATVDTIHTTLCEDRHRSVGDYEAPLKKALSHLNYDSELMKGYHDSGFTECYHLDSLQIIMDFLHSKLTKKVVNEEI